MTFGARNIDRVPDVFTVKSMDGLDCMKKIHKIAEIADWYGWWPKRFWALVLSKLDREHIARGKFLGHRIQRLSQIEEDSTQSNAHGDGSAVADTVRRDVGIPSQSALEAAVDALDDFYCSQRGPQSFRDDCHAVGNWIKTFYANVGGDSHV